MFWRRTRNRRLLRTHARLVTVEEDAAVKAADAVRVGKAADAGVRVVDAVPARVGPGAAVKADRAAAAVKADRVAAARARADADRGAASRRVIRRLLPNRRRDRCEGTPLRGAHFLAALERFQ
jgi:hypothetical protein